MVSAWLNNHNCKRRNFSICIQEQGLAFAQGLYCNVTHYNGCTATASATVNQPAVLTATATAIAVTCNGVRRSNRNRKRWYFSLFLFRNRNRLCMGVYSIAVTDNNGCITTSITVSQLLR